MLLLNFAHPLTENQLVQLHQLLKHDVADASLDVRDMKTQLDVSAAFVPEVVRLVERIGLSPEEWQRTPILVNLPSLNTIAALVIAELHGRTGHFPTVLRMRPILNSVPQQFELAELLNLQAVRDAARLDR
jgi:hypothetical protein